MEQGTISTDKTEKRYVATIYQNVEANLIGYISTVIVTSIVGGVAFVVATGGVFFSLPSTVKAIEEKSIALEQLIEEQQAVSRDQQEYNNTQRIVLENITSTLEEIKQDIRDINNSLL